jgi:iron complex transport system substrate-binding protein
MLNNSALSASQREKINEINTITDAIIAESIEIHKKLGPGLLESVYEMVLAKKLERRGYKVERQKIISFEYEDIHFEEGFRVDLLIEDMVVVELKSVEKTSPVHQKQLLTYLKLLDKTVGLLINFGCVTLKEGLQRIVNKYPDSAFSAPLREDRL